MGVDHRATWRRETFAFKKRPPRLTEVIGLPDGTRAYGVHGSAELPGRFHRATGGLFFHELIRSC